MSRPCPDPAVAAQFETIRDAYVRNDHAALLSVVNERMGAALPPERFAASSLTLGPLLADPAHLSYMDALKEGDHVVHFWKIESGAARDVLLRMSIRDGRGSGLLFSAPFDTAMKAKT